MNWQDTISPVAMTDPSLLLTAGIPLVLLLSFTFLAIYGRRFALGGGYIASTISFLAFVVSGFCYYDFSNNDQSLLWNSVEWFSFGGNSIQVGILLDGISLRMLTMVTGVTFLVHLFSLSYIAEDPMRNRYWAYLSLFSAAMCGLVISDNLLLMFVFWELVGLASWLLIGFWFKDKLPALGSQKAFIVNRIADAGFIMALMMIWAKQGNFYFLGDTVQADMFIGLGLLIGAMGKSAQFPFQVWLPDAMAGPTPVSSLIHAATMVAAGVYMLIRTQGFFVEDLQAIMAVIGAITALIAAYSALSQTDIKKVLAYSTISQLGFMIMGIGVGALESSFYHLLAHAFFKCGLFLVAAAIIYKIHEAQHKTHTHFDPQDMRFMGGMRKQMPLVFVAWIIFAASLSGLPFTSGFLSKDGLLLEAMDFAYEGPAWYWIVPVAGIIASFMTAFYITRQGMLVFGGKSRADGGVGNPDFSKNLSKSPLLMRIPLLLLAICSFWWILSPANPFHLEHLNPKHFSTAFSWVFVANAAIGILLAILVYKKGPSPRVSTSLFFNLSYQHFYFDLVWEAILVKPFLKLGKLLSYFDHYVIDGLVHLASSFILRNGQRPSLSTAAEWTEHHLIDRTANEIIQEHEKHSLSKVSAWMDKNLIDRLVNGLAFGVSNAARRVGKLQSGKLQLYIIYTLLAVLLLILSLIYIFAG